MPHKLLISYSVTLAELSDVALRGDVIRGIPNLMSFKIKNIGESQFPGGKILRAGFRLPWGMTTTEAWVATEVNVPPIDVGKEMETGALWKFIPPGEGAGTLYLQMQSADNQPINYYQTEKFATGTEEWRNIVFSVNRESLMIIDLLKKLLAGSKERRIEL